MACTQKYYLVEEQIVSTEWFSISDFEIGKSLYEVVKILNGKALFFEAHLQRLRESAKKDNKTIPFSSSKVRELVNRLIQKNNVQTGRLKFLFRYHNNSIKFFAFFLNDITPAPNLYKEGVKTVFYHAERILPNIKMINYELRRNVKQYIADHNAFEALLVNKDNTLTEGSKSNFFGIIGDQLITPPEKNILAGITRRIVFEICKEHKIDIVEQAMPIEHIIRLDSAFITGTSIAILPIKQIDQFFPDPANALLNKIALSYNQKVKDYLAEKII